MTRYILLSLLLVSPIGAQTKSSSAHPTKVTLKPPFVGAVEAVVDAADDIETSAPEATYAMETQRAKVAQSALGRMVTTDAEKSVAAAVSMLLLSIETRRSALGNSPDVYEDYGEKVLAQRLQIFNLIHRSKGCGIWGPLAPSAKL